MKDKSKLMLNIDDHVIIHPNNWFEHNYSNVLYSIKEKVRGPNNLMILVSAGMGAKILITDLYKLYPKSIIFDIGSAIAIQCSGKFIGDFEYTYDEITKFLSPLFE